MASAGLYAQNLPTISVSVSKSQQSLRWGRSGAGGGLLWGSEVAFGGGRVVRSQTRRWHLLQRNAVCSLAAPPPSGPSPWNSERVFQQSWQWPPENSERLLFLPSYHLCSHRCQRKDEGAKQRQRLPGQGGEEDGTEQTPSTPPGLPQLPVHVD